MKKFSENVYDISYIGSFGRFSSGNSFPIDYVQASFTAADLLDLSFARELHPDGQDFELLMQRDIDHERVLRDVVPYLNPTERSDQEIKDRAVFFPPLLVAIVPVQDRKMQPYYPDEVVTVDTTLGSVTREWPRQIKLDFFTDESGASYSPSLLINGKLQKVALQRSPVKLSVRSPKGNEQGAKLVVIDGQHRLAALRYVYERKSELLEGVCVPVCILFPPNSTQAHRELLGDKEVLTVHSVFRTLFVDVNTTMQHVGGHFNILLSDSSISGIICRKFCDGILKNRGEESLAQIEWNIKSKKESTIIKRPYSITSIGILDKALTKIFSGGSVRNNKSILLAYALALSEVEEQLNPQDNDSDDNRDVEWERFSLNQKRIIEAQVVKHFVPCLEEIFFGLEGFKTLSDQFSTQIAKLKTERDSSRNPTQHTAALTQILEYKPIDDDKHHESAKNIYSEFEESLRSSNKDNIVSFLQYAIVQRGILEAWSVVLDRCKDLGIAPIDATKAFIPILNHALREDGELFKPHKKYMQYTVWEAINIKPTEDSKTAISNCILTLFATDAIASDFAVSVSPADSEKLRDRLHRLGCERAGLFMNQYHDARQRYFMKTYRVEFATLDDEERALLISLEEEHNRQLQAVRHKQIPQDEVSNDFLKAVAKHVNRDVQVAIADFRSAFDYEYGIAIDSSVEIEGE